MTKIQKLSIPNFVPPIIFTQQKTLIQQQRATTYLPISKNFHLSKKTTCIFCENNITTATLPLSLTQAPPKLPPYSQTLKKPQKDRKKLTFKKILQILRKCNVKDMYQTTKYV